MDVFILNLILNSNLFTEYITEIKLRLKNSAVCLYTGTFTKPKYCPYVQSTCMKKKIRRILLLMFETKWVKESREFLFRRKYLFLCVKKWGVKIRYKQIWIFRREKSGKQKIFSTRKEYLKKKWMDEILLEFFFRRIFPMCDNEWGKKSTGKTKSLENFKCFSLYTNFPSRLFSSHVWNVFVNGNISMENIFRGLSKNKQHVSSWWNVIKYISRTLVL